MIVVGISVSSRAEIAKYGHGGVCQLNLVI